MKNTGIVFLHGAGLGSFIWDDMKAFIKYPALYVDFPNRNSSENTIKNSSFQDYINYVIEQITLWNTNEFILVTHSISGSIGLKLFEYFEDRINGFIALSSIIPRKNSSFISCLSFPQKILMPVLLNLFGTKPPNKSILHELCNDLSKFQSDKVIKNFTPESKSLFVTKVKYKDVKIKTLYVKLLNDKSFSIEMQNRMITNFKPDKVIELPGGHLPMLSRPKKLAEIINNFIRTI